MKTEYEMEINGHDFTVSQIAHGEHADKWVWSTDDGESDPFAEAWEAQANALHYVRELEAAEREFRQSDEYHRAMATDQRINDRLGK